MMQKKIPLIITLLLLSTVILCCKNHKTLQQKSLEIKYLDEYILYNDTIFKEAKIGGLSGIEYHKEKGIYYIVCDDAKNPRFYEASIDIKKDTFSSITFNKVIILKDKNGQFSDSNTLDLESLRILGKEKIIFSSEGSIRHNFNPSIFITDQTGNYQDQYMLPSYFQVDSESKNKPRHNGAFEGLASDHNNSGYWAAMELPLELDGEEPTIDSAGAPIRITHFDTATKQADFQFVYPLDKLAKDPKDKFGVNGVTALIQLTENQFLIIERGFASGYGTQGNTVRIYLTDNSTATNTLDHTILGHQKITPAKKTLLFDFESIRDQLTDTIVDNIEGVTLGPTLSNGNLSLILVSDNNFNPVSKQINQFILLELIQNR